jgi:hypothetical protein
VCRKDAFHDEIDDTAVRRRPPQRAPFRPTPARRDRRAVHRSAALQQCRHRGAAAVGSGGGWHKAGGGNPLPMWATQLMFDNNGGASGWAQADIDEFHNTYLPQTYSSISAFNTANPEGFSCA